MLITHMKLLKCGAPYSTVRAFKEEFPEGVLLSKELVERYIEVFSTVNIVMRMLPCAQRALYLLHQNAYREQYSDKCYRAAVENLLDPVVCKQKEQEFLQEYKRHKAMLFFDMAERFAEMLK